MEDKIISNLTIRQVTTYFLQPHQQEQLTIHLAFYLNEIVDFFELRVKFRTVLLNQPELRSAKLTEQIFLLLEKNGINWQIFFTVVQKHLTFGSITNNLLNEAENNRLHFVQNENTLVQKTEQKEVKIHFILRIPR